MAEFHVTQSPGPTEELTLALGPQHPSTHGVFQVMLGVDGEKVTRADPHVGFLHRCHEKIYESLPYHMIIPYLDRMDYLSATLSEWPYVLAAERLVGGIEVPKRAEYLRVIVGETNRILSHLIWLGTYLLDLGALTPFLYTFREREKIFEIIEKLTGERLMQNYLTIGGVRRDIYKGFEKELNSFLDYFQKVHQEYKEVTVNNPVFISRTRGVGVMKPERAIELGWSGPVLRASSVAFDLRRNDPYSVYPELEFDIITEPNGDCESRSRVRVREMLESARIVREALAKLPEGPIQARVPRTLRPAAGSTVYARTEGARGEYGVFLMADGTEKPWRAKLRSASFANLQGLAELFIGSRFADCIAILGSIDIVMGEVDR